MAQTTANARNNVEELVDKAKDKVQETSDTVREAVREVTDDIAETVVAGRDAASDNVRQLRARNRVQTAIDQAADRAHEFADWGISATFDGVDQARETYDRYSRETTTYIRRQPVKSVLLAAGIGAALAALLVGSISSRRGD